MTHPAELEVNCEDFLRDNRYLYALKARRKKIALIRVCATNTDAADIRIRLGESELIAGGESHAVEPPTTIIRKLSEFTWDFLLYAILSFHPVLLVVDLCLLLIGPLYNRRLRKQLRSLSDGEMRLKPGEQKAVLLGFRGVSKGTHQAQLSLRWDRNGDKQRIQCDIPFATPA